MGKLVARGHEHLKACVLGKTTNCPDETGSTAESARVARQHLVLCVILYVCAFGPLALISQPMWDDMSMLAHSSQSLWELFKQAGRREHFFLMAPFTALGLPLAWTVTSVLLCGLVPLLVYGIVRRATAWSAADAFWVAVLTATAPLNQARFTVATIPYAFSAVAFGASLWLLLKDLARPRAATRIAVALLLLLSFTTNSFLVLAWLVPAILAVKALRGSAETFGDRLHAATRAVLARGELLVLPVLYWGAKLAFQPTYGVYADYNKFRMPVPAALLETAATFVDQIEGARLLVPDREAFTEALIYAAAVSAMVVVLAARWRLPWRTGWHRGASGRAADLIAVAIGALLVVSAIFPYAIVGQAPRFAGLWETRHQVPQMLVIGFASYALLRLILGARKVWVGAAALAFAFLLADLSFSRQMLADAHEARAIANAFARSRIRPGTMVLVLEHDRQFRALGRHFPFYELSPIVNAAPGGASRLAVSNREVLDPATGNYVQSAGDPAVKALVGLCERFGDKPQFGFGQFKANGSIAAAELKGGVAPPRLAHGIAIALLALAGSRAADEARVRPLVSLEIEVKQVGLPSCSGPCCAPRA